MILIFRFSGHNCDHLQWQVDNELLDVVLFAVDVVHVQLWS